MTTGCQDLENALSDPRRPPFARALALAQPASRTPGKIFTTCTIVYKTYFTCQGLMFIRMIGILLESDRGLPLSRATAANATRRFKCYPDVSTGFSLVSVIAIHASLFTGFTAFDQWGVFVCRITEGIKHESFLSRHFDHYANWRQRF